MKTARSAPTGACPPELLGGLDGDEPARGYILEQDREIAEKIRPLATGDQEHQPGRAKKK